LFHCANISSGGSSIVFDAFTACSTLSDELSTLRKNRFPQSREQWKGSQRCSVFPNLGIQSNACRIHKIKMVEKMDLIYSNVTHDKHSQLVKAVR
jgi:hypothetical protein